MKGMTWIGWGAVLMAAGALAGCRGSGENIHPDPGASVQPKEIEIALVT